MRMRYVLVLVVLFSTFLGPAVSGQDQQLSSSSSSRRIVRQTAPKYPEVAKKMSLGGTVKLIANVNANGDVKFVEPVGGSPVLLQAARDAVSRWKYAPGGESRENIELHFAP